MGFFSRSSSSSSSQTTNINETVVPTAGAQDSSLAISAAGNVEYNALDAGAIEGAMTFSAAALENALKFASDSLGLAERANTQAAKAQEKALEKSISAVDESQSGGAQRLLYFGIAALAVFGFVVLKGAR